MHTLEAIHGESLSEPALAWFLCFVHKKVKKTTLLRQVWLYYAEINDERFFHELPAALCTDMVTLSKCPCTTFYAFKGWASNREVLHGTVHTLSASKTGARAGAAHLPQQRRV